MRKAFRWLAPLLILTLLLSLAGCGSSKEKSIEETLAFPQTRWDMPPQDVIQALGLKPGLYHQEEEPYDPQQESPYGTCRITIEAYRVFGAKGECVFHLLRPWFRGLAAAKCGSGLSGGHGHGKGEGCRSQNLWRTHRF